MRFKLRATVDEQLAQCIPVMGMISSLSAAGAGWVVTDNDGTDDSSGETFFWSVGQVAAAAN